MLNPPKDLACYDSPRDDLNARMNPQAHFKEILSGTNCATNWYEGTGGDIGEAGVLTPFPLSDAPALLGFDDDIGKYCESHQPFQVRRRDRDCRHAAINILQLGGSRVPYNLCRNLEWQTCAARGAALPPLPLPA